MKSPLVLFSALLLLTPASGAEAASTQPVGSAVVVVNLVTAAFNRDTRTLQSGDRVNQNELIEVGLDASSELELDDDTKLALGPGSRLTLDKFVYDPAKSKGSIVLDLVKGTFRFMTGVAEKPTYVINTPSAAITVRGTIFDVYVEDEDGMSWLLLHEGAVQVCNQRNQCRDHNEPGKLIRITEDGDVGAPVRWAALPGKDKVKFDDAFPFVVKAPAFDPSPIFTPDAIILGKLPGSDKPDTYEEPKHKETYDKPKKRKPTKETRNPKYEKPKKKKREASKADDAAKAVILGTGIAVGIGLLNKGKGGGGYNKPGRPMGGGYGHGGRRP